jgi:hypothetical protein
MGMAKECRIYSGNASYRIFAPDQLDREGDTFVLIYSGSLTGRLKAFMTNFQVGRHGGIMQEIRATPHIDYKQGYRHVPSMPIIWLSTLQTPLSVRVINGFSPKADWEMDTEK